jgi:hypothetical protein
MSSFVGISHKAIAPANFAPVKKKCKAYAKIKVSVDATTRHDTAFAIECNLVILHRLSVCC